MHQGCFMWTPTPPLSGQRTPRLGPARVCVCVPCLAGSGGPASRARFGAPHLFFGRSWFALCLSGPLPAGVAPFVVVVGSFFSFLFPFPFSPSVSCFACFPAPGALGLGVLSRPPPFFLFPSPPSVRPVVSCLACFPAWGALGLGVLSPPPLLFFAPPPSCGLWRFLLVLWCPVFFFCFYPCWWRWFLVVPRWFWAPGRFRVVSVSLLCLCGAVLVCCVVALCSVLSCPRGAAGVLCCCLLCLCVCCWAWLSSVVSWWVLMAPGVASRWRAVVCPWVLCCAVLLRVVPPGVALLCAVLFRSASFCAAARCVVSWGPVRLFSGVLRLLAPCFVLSPRAVCVLLWCVAAWCCSPLCFVPCAPWGVVLCVSCRLRPVRCCCVARSPPVPCSPVLCPVVLCCRVVPWCPALPPCWVCFLRGCGCTYLKNRCKTA